MYYCLSDIHIQDAPHAPLYTAEKESAFLRVTSEANASSATMVLAGDVFDLTGMAIPKGLGDFWRELGIDRPVPPPRTPAEMIHAVAARFPATLAALTPFATSNRLWVIPGNHDCALRDLDVQGALLEHVGGAAASLNFMDERQIGPFLLIGHGQEYDASNSTAKSCENRGAAITRALYHAVIPALVEMGMPAEVAEYIPAVRPEENIVDGIQKYLEKKATKKFLIAFVKLLEANGYWTGVEGVKVWIASHVVKGLLTPESVRKNLAGDTDVKELVRKGALKLLKSRATKANPPKVVVMGHTHELDARKHYVNLGTWVDHVRGLTPPDLVRVERALPVLVIDEINETARLEDASRPGSKPIWRYPSV